MTRGFLADALDPGVFAACVELASRAPSAGKSQGWNLVVLEGDDTSRYWDLALPTDKRPSFAFPGLLCAPLLAIVCADSRAYLERYSEPDKVRTGLGESAAGWPAPYWTIDAAFSTMVLLLALENEGLGSLFFAHAAEDQVRREFAIPVEVTVLGMVAVGRPDPGSGASGRSVTRPRRPVDDIIRRGRW